MSTLVQAAAAARARLEGIAFRGVPGGRIRGMEGLLLVAEGLAAPIGALVEVETAGGPVAAEVVGFRDRRLLLAALGRARVGPEAAAWLRPGAGDVPVGDALFGRVLGPLAEPLDGLGPLRPMPRWPLDGRPVPPLARAEVTQAMPTGVRAIDALLTLGRGQRVGLIAGSGVGKSVLLQQMVQGAAADAVVVALVGERGREISGFLAGLAPEARARTLVVAVPADAAAPARIRGCLLALGVAEWVRSTGRHALLLIDSLTRVAQAQREMGLSAGEAPGARGYPPSALALIPSLVERAGNDSRTGGAVTALMTVLADGDDTIADPVADTARGVLDGHILLDRRIAARGRFPAIDLGLSISRTMTAVVPPAHRAAAAAFRRDLALAEANADLVTMGAHVAGQDPAIDRALALRPQMEALLGQEAADRADFADSVARLLEGWGG